jgi:hypothetical protein
VIVAAGLEEIEVNTRVDCVRKGNSDAIVDIRGLESVAVASEAVALREVDG